MLMQINDGARENAREITWVQCYPLGPTPCPPATNSEDDQGTGETGGECGSTGAGQSAVRSPMQQVTQCLASD
jgi:hypothetical protein